MTVNGIAYPADAVTGSPTYTGLNGRNVLSSAMAGATSARPLGGFTGVRPGTPTTTVTASSTIWGVGAFSGYIDLEATTTNSGYFFTVAATASGGSVTAAGASARVDLIYVQIADSNTGDGSGGSPRVIVDYQAGVAGAGIPTLSAARAFVIAQINVPSAGSPTVTWVAPYTVAAGGIVPAASSTVYPAAATYPGQYLDDLALGQLFRSNGSSWVSLGPLTGRFKGTITTSKAVAVNALWGKSTGPTFDSTDDPLSGFSSTTGLYTCKVAGTYLVMVQAKANTSGFTTTGGLAVQKNGANVLQSGNNPSGGFTGLALSGYLRLALNDTVSASFGGAYTSQSDTPADNNYFELVQVQL